jgi:hypothetical protein
VASLRPVVMDYSTYTQAKYHEAQPPRLTDRHEIDSEPRTRRSPIFAVTPRLLALTRKLHVATAKPAVSH